MHLKMSSGKWRPSCLGLNVLIDPGDQKNGLHVLINDVLFLFLTDVDQHVLPYATVVFFCNLVAVPHLIWCHNFGCSKMPIVL